MKRLLCVLAVLCSFAFLPPATAEIYGYCTIRCSTINTLPTYFTSGTECCENFQAYCGGIGQAWMSSTEGGPAVYCLI